MGKNNVYAIAISLSDAEANAIASAVPGGAALGEKLTAVAGGLMKDLSKGGSMIPPEWASRIEAAIGTTEPMAIVDHVEKAVGRAGDAHRIEWVVDPTQIEFYKMQADNAGISLPHQLKTHLDFAFANGWLGSSATDPFKLLFTSEQYRWMQQIFAKDIVTGEDVIGAIQGNPINFATDEDDDLVAQSLTAGGGE